MRFVPRNSFLCDRGREWISLRLDGELSELAQKMLDSHLVRCGDCRAFEEQVSGIALQLRSAPLEQLERPIETARLNDAPKASPRATDAAKVIPAHAPSRTRKRRSAARSTDQLTGPLVGRRSSSSVSGHRSSG